MYGVGEKISKCQKGICHPEFISGSHIEIPNRVRNDKKVKAAFTLAEVLITLGIIGVVAAMTIPTLIANYQEKQTVSRLTKAYAILSNAYAMAKTENGDFRQWGISSNSLVEEDDEGNRNYSDDTVLNTELFWSIMTKNMKVLKQSINEKLLNGPHNSYLNVENTHTITTSLAEITLADGITLEGGYIYNYRCTGNQICLDFSIDINGVDNPPNIFGKDVFNFYLLDRGIIPVGSKDEENLGGEREFEIFCDRDGSVDYNGYGCAAWVIYNKNLDYLHCDDLSWDGKHKCSD